MDDREAASWSNYCLHRQQSKWVQTVVSAYHKAIVHFKFRFTYVVLCVNPAVYPTERHSVSVALIAALRSRRKVRDGKSR